MDKKTLNYDFDKLRPGNSLSEAPSPRWREMLLRVIRNGRRYLYPAKPSPYRGIGAVPNDQGVTFRVWAPNAHHVLVTGSFNRWSKERHPLASEGNGYWSAHISDARKGDEYKFVIHNNSARLIRTDPYARDIVAERNNGVISKTTRQLRSQPPTWMPKWNELVIYELHVGTFNPYNNDTPGQFQGVVEKLPPPSDAGPGQVEAGGGQHRHARQAQHPFGPGNAAGQPARLDKNVDVEDGAEKNHRRKKVEIAEDKSQGPVDRPLKGLRLGKNPLGDRIAVPVADIGEPGGFELSARAFGMTENAPFSGAAGIRLRCR